MSTRVCLCATHACSCSMEDVLTLICGLLLLSIGDASAESFSAMFFIVAFSLQKTGNIKVILALNEIFFIYMSNFKFIGTQLKSALAQCWYFNQMHSSHQWIDLICQMWKKIKIKKKKEFQVVHDICRSNIFSAGTVFRRQNLTSTDGPHSERIKFRRYVILHSILCWFILLLSLVIAKAFRDIFSSVSLSIYNILDFLEIYFVYYLQH